MSGRRNRNVSLVDALSSGADSPGQADAAPGSTATLTSEPVVDLTASNDSLFPDFAGRIEHGTRDDFEDKEAALWPDQAARLDALAARIASSNRRRGVKAPRRITKNTLIRIAIDNLLLDNAALTGATEAELRESLRRERG